MSRQIKPTTTENSLNDAFLKNEIVSIREALQNDR